MRPRLIIMAKEPRAGRVKTRLGQDIGLVPAAWWYRHQLARLTRRLTDPRWDITLAVAPDSALTSRALPAGTRRAQGPGDLGARMERLLRAERPAPAVLIGSDIPGVTPAHIARALHSLASHDMVFGPSEDGGFWLVGLSPSAPAPRPLFRNIRWSSPQTLADTRAQLGHLRLATTDTLRDVDTLADLPASLCP
ncbi:TIGR04282 family arsenosugar biosynthesis glycosyltransferase [Mesobacterium pallidum]|uniref:TIGR04282 family arsenosugar biosynthesis glycosyltransferase n=1 Tax=Mesobacterium pallidum TaxID=2872037 RepID=UPI001EE212C9|nr:TIGR04282 family arsenosugar biosynthesis glycosyltransferase [Mesobacterium pallidum]